MRDGAWASLGVAVSLGVYAVTTVSGRGYEVREAWLLVLPLLLLVATLVWAVVLFAWPSTRRRTAPAVLLLGIAAGAILLSLLAPGQSEGSADGSTDRRLEVALVEAFTAGPLYVLHRTATKEEGRLLGTVGSLLVLFAVLVTIRNAWRNPTEAAAFAVAQAAVVVLAVWVVSTVSAMRLPLHWARRARPVP